MKFEIANLAVAAVAAVGVAMGAMSARAADKDIVDTAVAAGQFNTLAAALTAAGLVETLKGAGPFTVFAPDRCRLRQAPGRHGRQPAQAGEQGPAHRGPHLPRRAGRGDGR